MTIENHDKKIYGYFFHLAKQDGKEQEFIARYGIYNKVKEEIERRQKLYNKMIDETQFMQDTTPFDTIEQNFERLIPIENELRTEIGKISVDEHHQPSLTDEIKASFYNYLNNTKSYFSRPEYNQEAIDLLYDAIGNFNAVISNTVFSSKKSLLEYQANLLPIVREVKLG